MPGWIKISRDIVRHWIFQDSERLKWWIDLLLMAQWEERTVMHDTRLVVLGKGEMVASVSFLCSRWGKSNKTVVRFLHLLESEGMIARRVVHRLTPIISICNYERYQCREDEPVQTLVQAPVQTIKEVKKEEKDTDVSEKKVPAKVFRPPSVEDVAAYCAERGNGVDAYRFVDFYSSKGWMVGKNKMKDWRAAVRTWERRNSGNERKTKNEMLNDTYRRQAAELAAITERELSGC